MGNSVFLVSIAGPDYCRMLVDSSRVDAMMRNAAVCVLCVFFLCMCVLVLFVLFFPFRLSSRPYSMRMYKIGSSTLDGNIRMI